MNMDTNDKKTPVEPIARIKAIREKYFPYTEQTVGRLVISATVMFVWLLFWALVLKLGREDMLIRNHTNLMQLTTIERIMWDLVPFNYRGSDYEISLQILTTVLNCFVFAPLGVTLSYLLVNKGKLGVLFGTLIHFGIVLAIELIQLFTMFGNFATEDFITNTVGYFIGVGLYFLLFKRLSAKHNVVFFSIINLLLVVMVVFSLITTIDAADVLAELFVKSVEKCFSPG